MANYAIIENGKVTNMVVAEPDYAREKNWIDLPGNVCIGFDYIDGKFFDNRPQLPTPQEPPALTKEELLAQLQALQAQIQALE